MNRLTPDQINSIVDDVVGPSWKQEKIASILQKGNDMDQQLAEKAQMELFDGNIIKVETGSVFGKIQNLAMEVIYNHKLTFDELMFLYSYDMAKRVKERIL